MSDQALLKGGSIGRRKARIPRSTLPAKRSRASILLMCLSLAPLAGSGVWAETFQEPPDPGPPEPIPFFDSPAVSGAFSDEQLLLLETAPTFQLLSLDPCRTRSRDVNSRRWFRGYRVVGRLEVGDPHLRRRILAAFYKAIIRPPNAVPNCFTPRHGISVSDGYRRLDLIICYECGYVQRYVVAVGCPDEGIHTTPGPELVFNEILGTKGVPLPPD